MYHLLPVRPHPAIRESGPPAPTPVQEAVYRPSLAPVQIEGAGNQRTQGLGYAACAFVELRVYWSPDTNSGFSLIVSANYDWQSRFKAALLPSVPRRGLEGTDGKAQIMEPLDMVTS